MDDEIRYLKEPVKEISSKKKVFEEYNQLVREKVASLEEKCNLQKRNVNL